MNLIVTSPTSVDSERPAAVNTHDPFGLGIPQAQQQEVFKKFVQLHNPQRDREPGLGLGLAIVGRLCGLLGHTVQVWSEPKRGSRFRVLVPQTALPPPDDAPHLGRGGDCAVCASLMPIARCRRWKTSRACRFSSSARTCPRCSKAACRHAQTSGYPATQGADSTAVQAEIPALSRHLWSGALWLMFLGQEGMLTMRCCREILTWQSVHSDG